MVRLRVDGHRVIVRLPALSFGLSGAGRVWGAAECSRGSRAKPADVVAGWRFGQWMLR